MERHGKSKLYARQRLCSQVVERNIHNTSLACLIFSAIPEVHRHI